MRLQPSEGPLQAVRNRNCNVLNSSKQLKNLTCNTRCNDLGTATREIVDNTDRLTIEDVAGLDTVDFTSTELRWAFTPDQQPNINRLNVDNMLSSQPQWPHSPDDALSDCSSTSVSPQEEDPDLIDSSSDDTIEDEEMMAPPVKGFVNPNYPGFQHLAHTLDFDENQLNNNDDYGGEDEQTVCLEEPICQEVIEDCQSREEPRKLPDFLPLKDVHMTEPVCQVLSPIESKMADAVLSDCQEGILVCESMETETSEGLRVGKEDLTRNCEEKEEDSTVVNSQKKRPSKDAGQVKRRKEGKKDCKKDCKKPTTAESFGEFDIYTIETAMPHIDLEAIESHLRAAKEEEQRRRTDREEIRRRLAMGNEEDYYTDRPGRKPSLQARLQSGMNLQICFMNETASDNESPSSDSECPLTNPKPPKTTRHNSNKKTPPQRPATLALQPFDQATSLLQSSGDSDFFSKQARLQTEARMALAQAKQMARMQMEIERQKQKKSPITEMVRHSLEKVGIPFPENKRRLSRQILTEMNVAQLQVIVNDLHTQIETLNEQLVKMLMSRDDLHMEQDSMLVDIEDLTRYLGAKEQVLKQTNIDNGNNNPQETASGGFKPHLDRIASLVKK
ncbi:uncharacterized protein Schip1 isoform X2 [Euwallacea similis]|uniref:uncharacterized protein Schip1 isoform X2 n=1 Tax=Euwallacea similis TaxID=1736056 RepID=UPI00344D0799